MLTTAIGRLRLTGFFEGLSYLVLLGIAMPLKYLYGMPQAVQVIGMAHGILFILYIMMSVHGKILYRWSLTKMFLLWVASVLPFGPFIADYKLLRDELAPEPKKVS